MPHIQLRSTEALRELIAISLAHEADGADWDRLSVDKRFEWREEAEQVLRLDAATRTAKDLRGSVLRDTENASEIGRGADLWDVVETMRSHTARSVQLIDYFAGLFAQETVRENLERRHKKPAGMAVALVEREMISLAEAQAAYDCARHMLEAREAHFSRFGMTSGEPEADDK